VGITEEEKEFWPHNLINKGASLLTFDPRTGFCEFRILGKAYVIVDSGDFPLSNHQVWGLQDLISEARDVYHCDPEHMQRGHQELLRFARDYRNQNYGPLTIYEPRTIPLEEYSEDLSMKTAYDPEDHQHYHHRHYGTNYQRNVDHSYGKYMARTRCAPPGEELLIAHDGAKKQRAKASRIPDLFKSCHVMD
jgi:hypothetical protein